MNYKELHGKTIREGFEQFIKDNPKVWFTYTKLVLNQIREGKKQIRTKAIFAQMRDMEIASTDKNFRVNDAYQSYFPRLFVERLPGYAKYFKFRKQRNEDIGPFMEVDGDSITFTKSIN